MEPKDKDTGFVGFSVEFEERMQLFTEKKQNNEGSVLPLERSFNDSGLVIGPTFTDFEWIHKIARIKLASYRQHPATIDKVNDSPTSNRVQSGKSLNYDGGNCVELHAGVDPLVESIYTLQSAQEALGKEVLKFREVGILLDVAVDGAVHDSPSEIISIDLKLQDTSSSKQMQSDKNMQSSFHSLHSEVKAAANRKYMGTELEDLFRLKIEAEVEYLAISRTTQKNRVAVKDKITPASEQFLKLNTLENTKNKASMLEKEAEKLVNSCEDIASAEKTLKLQMRICKYSSYFLIQLVILVLILGFLIFHISPNYDGVVPT